SDALDAVLERAAVAREAREALLAREAREAELRGVPWDEAERDPNGASPHASAADVAAPDGAASPTDLPWPEDGVASVGDGGRVARARIGEEAAALARAGAETQDAASSAARASGAETGAAPGTASGTATGTSPGPSARALDGAATGHAGETSTGATGPSAAGRAPTGTGGTATPGTRAAPAAGGSGKGTGGADVPEYGATPIQIPPVDLLDEPEPPSLDRGELVREHRDRVRQIDETLANFKLGGRVVAAVRGPTVTRFEVEPAPGEKISRFSNLSDDLALAMAAASVRIEAPIPGKSVIGLEVPNANRELVRFREAAESASFRRTKARLPIILGKSIDGEMVVGDLARMPHLLIAGSTGSGKSVAVN